MPSLSPYHLVAITAGEKPELARKFGLEFDVLATGNGPNTIQAILSGSLDFGAVPLEAAWPAQERSPELHQVMACANGSPYALLVNPDVKTAADLKGRAIGAAALRGAPDSTALQVLLLENDVQPDEYQLVQVGSLAERTAAMTAGTIAACAQLEPQASALREAGFPEIDNADNYPVLAQVQTVVLLSRKGWYEPNLALAASFAQAYVDLTRWLYDPGNREELIRLIASTLRVEEPAATNTYDRHIVKSRTPTPNGRIDPEMSAQLLENLRRLGATGLPADPARFVDQSIVERAGV
jgi:ABC-type nitrate/sulfonate/bicarbonate transport system substrate-binding protein